MAQLDPITEDTVLMAIYGGAYTRAKIAEALDVPIGTATLAMMLERVQGASLARIEFKDQWVYILTDAGRQKAEAIEIADLIAEAADSLRRHSDGRADLVNAAAMGIVEAMTYPSYQPVTGKLHRDIGAVVQAAKIVFEELKAK